MLTAVLGLICRHGKSPISTSSEGVPCFSRPLNSQCGRNAAYPLEISALGGGLKVGSSYPCPFRPFGRQSSQMILPYLVSGGSGRFFCQINRRGKLHRLGQTIAVKLPNVPIPAPLNTNFQTTAGIHLNSMRLRNPILLTNYGIDRGGLGQWSRLTATSATRPTVRCLTVFPILVCRSSSWVT